MTVWFDRQLQLGAKASRNDWILGPDSGHDSEEGAIDAVSVGNVARWVHVLAAVAWLGEVLVVIFVLAPAVRRLRGESRLALLKSVYPRIFRLASVLSATAVASGIVVFWARFNWSFPFTVLVNSAWGRWILVGASLGTVLTVFHFFVEAKLEPAISGLEEPKDVDRMVWIVTYVPRVGVLFLIGAALSMMYAARGL